MNNIVRPNNDREEMARLQAAVGRHMLPDFVVGVDIQLGDFDGDPAAWIVFRLTGSDAVGLAEVTRRAEILFRIRQAIRADWFEAGGDRFPFFRSEYAETVLPA